MGITRELTAARGTRSLAGAKAMRARRKNAALTLSYILQNPGNMDCLGLDGRVSRC